MSQAAFLISLSARRTPREDSALDRVVAELLARDLPGLGAVAIALVVRQGIEVQRHAPLGSRARGPHEVQAHLVPDEGDLPRVEPERGLGPERAGRAPVRHREADFLD